MNEIDYSIVIPHHNIPKLLERCLKSIPTWENIQIIVVDDNSSSDIVDFNKFPGKDNSNVCIVFTKEGKGAGYARNVAIPLIKGKWTIFADADDFFDGDFGACLKRHLYSKSDIIFFKTRSVDNETLESVQSRMSSANAAISKKHYEELRYGYEVPWGKMIKTDLFQNKDIFFDEVEVGNDAMFSHKIGCEASKISCDESYFYVSTVRKGSLATSTNLSRMQCRFEGSVRQYRFYKQRGIWRYRKNLIEISLSFYKHSKKLFFKNFKTAIKEESLGSIVYDVIRIVKHKILW